MRMKRLLLALSLSLLVGKSFAISFKVDGISYVVNADTAIIKGYSEIPANGELTLASTVSYGGKDYRVTTVQNSAFLSCTDLKKLIIPANIKYIQSGAFENCVNMTQLVLSEGEERLDAASDAFKNCSIEEAEIGRNLKESIFRNSEFLVSVKMTKNVTTIPSYAFSNCKKLSSINLEKVRLIGENAFFHCFMLKEINIANIEKIEREAFYGSGVERIELPETLEELSFQCFAYCKSLKQACINGNLLEIPQYCFFGCSSLESIELSLSVRKICYDAFRDCINLNQISWGNISIIQSGAFENTGFEEVSFPKTLCELQFDSFLNCRNLKKIDLSKTQLETVNGFEGCVSLEQVVFPDNLREIEKRCFGGCSALATLELPASLEKVSDMAFCGMKSLKSIDLSRTKVYTIPYCCFYNCVSLEKVTLNALTDSICDSAFENCSNLSDLLNTSNIQIVYKDAFKGTLLFSEDIVGPMMIGTAMYRYGGKIEDKEYVVPSSVTCLCDGVFANKNIQTIKLNDGLKYIGEGVFDNCLNLVSLSIPRSVDYVGGSSNCKSLALLQIEADRKSLNIGDFSGSNVKKIYLGRSLSSTLDWVPDMESLTIGKEVKTLNASFSSSDKLVYLEFEDSPDMLDLGNMCVKKVSVLHFGRPIKVCSLINHESNNFSNIEDLTIGKYLTEIPELFADGGKLTELFIPSNVKTIGRNAFSGMKNLKKISFSDGLIKIGNAAFYGCTSIDTLIIPGTVEEIAIGAFHYIGCKKLILKEGVGLLNTDAFYGLQTDSLVLPSTVKLAYECFANSSLKYVDASRCKSNFGRSFHDCENIETLIMPKDGMTELVEYEFSGCKKLKNIVLPNSLEKIAHSVFAGTNIDKVYVPESVKTISDSMYESWMGKKTDFKPAVYIDGSVQSEPIKLNNTFSVDLSMLDVKRSFLYSFYEQAGGIFEENTNTGKRIILIDTLIIRDIKEFSILTKVQSQFAPTTAICLSPYLTSCDLWKPTNGKVLVLPGSQLPKDDITEMYTVNKLAYEQPADGDVLFDGVNNMPFKIAPVFFQDNKEVTLKEAGVYDLSMKISGTSFDGIYPTGLKVTVSTASGIDNVPVGEQQRNCPIYNMNGQRIDDSYKGIVIQNGKKRIAK